ncbi:MAG TPA: serine/threonine-protein kinase [Candidatus Dormibacteraeota bacterium]|nr:serine/threonine-protein kinase [Candidatus Dormibacteraeota bacterium]
MSIGTGTKLGQYEVQDFVGQGAMGVVYRAYHSQLERIGAVKVMQAITPDPDTVARFRHEAQAIAKLRHPNIVDVYDFGEFQGTPYMIVEYIPGGSLAGRMAEGTLDRATALKYLRGIASGLDYAHARGVVHRDVKPANVLLTADDTPVLADFGLAKLMQGSSLKSMTGVTTGTPAYMAPEQVTGSRVGPAADRYSLATIAYEMLTGLIPFDGEGLMELLYAQVHRYPPPPSARDASLGHRVDEVVMRGLAKEPTQRWDSATAFVDALEAALGPEPAVAATMVVAPSTVRSAPVTETAVMERVEAPSSRPVMTLAYPSPPPAVVPARKSRRSTLAWLALGVILALLVVGVAGWVATHRPVTFSLSSTTVTAGDSVVLAADHLPPNQAGRVELWSAQYTYPFRANGSGHVDVTFTVPNDIGPGDHQVKLCWNGSCRLEQTLHVLAPVAGVSPAPSPSASPSPKASPSPSALPTITPTGASGRTLTSLSSTIKIGNSVWWVQGKRFVPNRVFTFRFVQYPTATDEELLRGVVGPDGGFQVSYSIPVTVRPGVAYLEACDPFGCASTSVNVLGAS